MAWLPYLTNEEVTNTQRVRFDFEKKNIPETRILTRFHGPCYFQLRYVKLVFFYCFVSERTT
jgi:hypothetical protein